VVTFIYIDHVIFSIELRENPEIYDEQNDQLQTHKKAENTAELGPFHYAWGLSVQGAMTEVNSFTGTAGDSSRLMRETFLSDTSTVYELWRRVWRSRTERLGSNLKPGAEVQTEACSAWL